MPMPIPHCSCRLWFRRPKQLSHVARTSGNSPEPIYEAHFRCASRFWCFILESNQAQQSCKDRLRTQRLKLTFLPTRTGRLLQHHLSRGRARLTYPYSALPASEAGCILHAHASVKTQIGDPCRNRTDVVRIDNPLHNHSANGPINLGWRGRDRTYAPLSGRSG